MSRKAALSASSILASFAASAGAPEPSELTTDLEEVIVTGTRISGTKLVGAQVIELTRETIDNRGYYNLEDALRSLPQMSNIGASPVLQSVSSPANNLNYGKGSSVNLRGLGPDATLVLLNGRRIASSGTGTFYDVSQIPLAAVERVDIVTDGASAIYGSEAVGGIVNIITPRSLRGVSLEASGTFADDYHAERASLASGHDWKSGGMTAAIEYRHTDLLLAEDRDFYGADQTRFGGPDLRLTRCAPGNVTAAGVTYALPPGDGVGLTSAQLVPGTSNRCDIQANRSLYPRADSFSGVLHAEQELGGGLNAFADVFYSRRKSYGTQVDQTATLTVPSSNPWFIPFSSSPSSVQVQYNFVNDMGRQYNVGRATSLTAVGGVDYHFAPEWRASVFYGLSRTRDTSESMNDLNTYYINAALASSDPETAFNPFGSGGNGNQAIIDSFSGYSIRPTRIVQHQVQGVIDGPVGNPWGAGDVRVAFGGEWLDQDYLETNRRLSNTPDEVPGVGSASDRSNKALFAEVSIPLVGPETAFDGLRSAKLSIAVRGDDYNDFGTTVNPRFGIDLEPFTGLHLRGSWGDSFKAPYLSQLSPAFTASVSTVADPTSPTGTTTILNTSRKDSPLSAQTAESWTAGLAYSNSNRTPLTFSATYFHVDYTDRIESLSANTIMANPSVYANFISRNPTAEQIAAIQSDPNLSAPFTLPPSGVGAIVYSGTRNVAALAVHGVDVAAGYWWQTGLGRLSLNGAVTRMLGYDTQSATGLPSLAALGRIGFPNEWRASGDVALETGTFRVFTGVNLLGAYDNTLVASGQRIPRYVTVNAGVRLSLDGMFDVVPDGASLQLSALNLLDRGPPLVLGNAAGFDGTAADPIGRQVTLSLRMRF